VIVSTQWAFAYATRERADRLIVGRDAAGSSDQSGNA
jgi:hypothetical protein